MFKLVVEEQYIRMLSTRLDRFRQVGAHKFNCRCPICGDSKKSASKARFFIFPHTDGAHYTCKCHNCGYNRSFDKFLDHIDPELHKEYVINLLQAKSRWEDDTPQEQMVEQKRKSDVDCMEDLTKISQLRPGHPARNYLNARKIPHSEHYRLYYTDNFKKWGERVAPGTFTSKQLQTDFSAVVLLINNEDGVPVAAQGKPLTKDTPIKYVTVTIDPTAPRLFGLGQVDPNQIVYVLEGPFDSLFIPNSLASCGGDITSDLSKTSIEKNNIVIVYDNENRNEHTINKVRQAIDDGYAVVLWPNNLSHKDVNDMILAGYTPREVRQMLSVNVSSGLEAKLNLAHWRKV